jgi:hypothetical protein
MHAPSRNCLAVAPAPLPSWMRRPCCPCRCSADREVHCRSDRKLVRLLKQAHSKYPQAAIEDIDARPTRGIDHRTVMSLAMGDWVSLGPPFGPFWSLMRTVMNSVSCGMPLSAKRRRRTMYSRTLRLSVTPFAMTTTFQYGFRLIALLQYL